METTKVKIIESFGWYKAGETYIVTYDQLTYPFLPVAIGKHAGAKINSLHCLPISKEEDNQPSTPADKPYDNINPSHYKNSSKETYQMMIDIWGKDAYIAHCEMCAFKYRMRLGLKPNNPIQQDLDKAIWYEQKAKELRNQ